MKRLQAVLDTNVLISGLCFGGLPARILELALEGKIELITSAILIKEFREVMRLKFPRREADIEDTLRELSLLWNAVDTGRLRLSVIKEEPDDNRVLECAVAGGARFIVSGDKHLLALGRCRDVMILSPRKFIDLLEQDRSLLA